MAYELDLPAQMRRIHNVFHLWLLHLVDDTPLPGQVQDPEQPAEFDPEMEDDMEYAVSSILDCRVDLTQQDPDTKKRGRPTKNKPKTISKGLLQYQALWADYPEGPDNPSWEPYMNMVESSEMVLQYHRDHPDKPACHPKFMTLAGKQDMPAMKIHGLSNKLL
jgi:hypothetical protein